MFFCIDGFSLNILILFGIFQIITQILTISTPEWDFSKSTKKIENDTIYISIAFFDSKILKTYIRNNKNYLQIENESIEITFSEINSFIHINDVYYICPNDYNNTNIYKYSLSTKTLVAIENPQLNSSERTPSKWSIKCLYGKYSSDSIIDNTEISSKIINQNIIISFLDTSYIYLFLTQTETWKELLKTDQYIIDTSLDENYIIENGVFYSLNMTIFDTSYKFCQYKIQFFNSNNNYFSLILDNITSIFTSLSSPYLFSKLYTSVTNGNSIYLTTFDTTNIIMKLELNFVEDIAYSSTFPLVIDYDTYNIINFGFIGNGHYYYYLVQSNITKIQYWGIGEIKSNTIIFNSKKEIISIRPYVASKTSLLVETTEGFFFLCALTADSFNCNECDFSLNLFLNPSEKNFCKVNNTSQGKIESCNPEEIYSKDKDTCVSCNSRDDTYIYMPGGYCLVGCDI